VGPALVDRFRLGAHRLAIWRSLPLIPEAALAVMLRHELEHARRYERSGPAFYEADRCLRIDVDRAGGIGYAELPSEREANAAAAAYAARTLTESERRTVAACAECAALLTTRPAPRDVVGETLSELARLAELDSPHRPGTLRPDEVDALRRECAAWAPTAVAPLATAEGTPPIVVVDPRESTRLPVWQRP